MSQSSLEVIVTAQPITTNDLAKNFVYHMQRLVSSPLPLCIPVWHAKDEYWLGYLMNIPFMQYMEGERWTDTALLDFTLFLMEQEKRNRRRFSSLIDALAEERHINFNAVLMMLSIQMGLEGERTKTMLIRLDSFGLCGGMWIVSQAIGKPPLEQPESEPIPEEIYLGLVGSKASKAFGMDARHPAEIARYGPAPRWL
jgi:hypothetical protein